MLDFVRKLLGGSNDAQIKKLDKTIDAIEARSGFDFFAAVPASLQAAAESSTSELW